MKRLLNFIYGIILLFGAIFVFYAFRTTDQWYSWLYLIPYVGLIDYAIKKIEKACK